MILVLIGLVASMIFFVFVLVLTIIGGICAAVASKPGTKNPVRYGHIDKSDRYLILAQPDWRPVYSADTIPHAKMIQEILIKQNRSSVVKDLLH